MIYPGTIWFKRFKHCIVISTVSVCFWVNTIQDQMMLATVNLAEHTEGYLPAANSVCKYTERAIPSLQLLEKSQLGNYIQDNEFITTEQIQKHIQSIRAVSKCLPQLSRLLEISISLLRMALFVMILQIIFSISWMIMDVRFGDSKLFSVSLIGIAILINLKTDLIINMLISLI